MSISVGIWICINYALLNAVDVTVDEIGFITGVAAALIQLFLVQIRTGGVVDHLKAFGTFAADNSVELIVMLS